MDEKSKDDDPRSYRDHRNQDRFQEREYGCVGKVYGPLAQDERYRREPRTFDPDYDRDLGPDYGPDERARPGREHNRDFDHDRSDMWGRGYDEQDRDDRWEHGWRGSNRDW